MVRKEDRHMVAVLARRVRKENSDIEPRFVTWLEQMKLLGSVFVARFIVWRELRREQKGKSSLKQ